MKVLTGKERALSLTDSKSIQKSDGVIFDEMNGTVCKIELLENVKFEN